MRATLQSIDHLLRGKLTRREDLLEGRIEVPVRALVVNGILLGALYGVCMGLFSVLRDGHPSWAQLVATTCKVPLLFLLTLLVTYPSLYVVSALFDSRLGHAETLKLLLAAMCANLALLASFGPVTAFFTLSTESYPFMVVLNVFFMGVAGFAGLAFLRKSLDAVFDVVHALPRHGAPAQSTPDATPGRPGDAPSGEPEMSALDIIRSRNSNAYSAPPSRRIFTFWLVIYGVVGAQMGWILRPFIGDPSQEFTLFRVRESNFFQALGKALRELLS